MDETMPRPVETDPRLTERRRCLAGVTYPDHVAFLYIMGKD